MDASVILWIDHRAVALDAEFAVDIRRFLSGGSVAASF
jgi:hypothetical protein